MRIAGVKLIASVESHCGSGERRSACLWGRVWCFQRGRWKHISEGTRRCTYVSALVRHESRESMGCGAEESIGGFHAAWIWEPTDVSYVCTIRTMKYVQCMYVCTYIPRGDLIIIHPRLTRLYCSGCGRAPSPSVWDSHVLHVQYLYSLVRYYIDF